MTNSNRTLTSDEDFKPPAQWDTAMLDLEDFEGEGLIQVNDGKRTWVMSIAQYEHLIEMSLLSANNDQ